MLSKICLETLKSICSSAHNFSIQLQHTEGVREGGRKGGREGRRERKRERTGRHAHTHHAHADTYIQRERAIC